ncbi:MAG: hypothetical protein K0B00_09725 [Rhodobacteraceae bacterium]|nr:hypothetical protein [Paracoccaceae bacterium]
MLLEKLLRRIGALLAIGAVAACASTQPIGPADQALVGTPLEGCCRETEPYPPVLVALIEPFAPAFGNLVGGSILRPGHLADPAPQAAALKVIKPLDVVVLSSKGRASGNTIPGLFGHLAMYLGSEAELRALGMWNHPSVAPHQAEIRAGATFIEADRYGVHLSTPEIVLDTDKILLLRPQLAGNARRREIVVGLASRLGMEFDYHFDNATPDVLYCAELVSIVMPELNMPTRTIYGRQSILPDDVAAQAAVRRSNLTFAAYFRGEPEGWAPADRGTLVSDLGEFWRRAKARTGASAGPGV